MRIDIVRPSCAGDGRDSRRGAARWPANWHFAGPGPADRSLHTQTTLRAAVECDRKTKEIKVAERLLADSKEERKEETERERYDDDGNGLRFIGSARRLSLISPITRHCYLMDSFLADPPFYACF